MDLDSEGVDGGAGGAETLRHLFHHVSVFNVSDLAKAEDVEQMSTGDNSVESS